MRTQRLVRTVIERDVHSCAMERIEQLYSRFDTVAVSFSGGKDSTVVLQLCLEVATAMKKLPVQAFFWDEEAIHPETLEYVERVRQRDDVVLKWLCLPVMHRNACSRRSPWWYCFDETCPELWCHEIPDHGIRTLPGFQLGMTIPEASLLVYGPEYGLTVQVLGIRANESLRRLQTVMKRQEENWLFTGDPWRASPIYDWTVPDVWTAPRIHGWDYNRAYDVLYKSGMSFHNMRVCPPFGEEPLENLWMYKMCWPDLWAKMVKRVPGAGTAARYSTSELYGYGGDKLPEGVTSWRDWSLRLIALFPNPYRETIGRNIGTMLKLHREKTNRPVPDTVADPYSGLSWRFIANVVNRGDLKGRRKGKLIANGIVSQKKLGLSLPELIDMERDDATRY